MRRFPPLLVTVLASALSVSDTKGANYTVLHHFTGSEGSRPLGWLVADGTMLFGTCSTGGLYNGGTLFSVRPDGLDFRVLHDFGSGTNDGFGPQGTPLIKDGRLWGTTVRGGSDDAGILFSVLPDGQGFTVLHNFEHRSSGDWSQRPNGVLVCDDSRIYGTTDASPDSAGGIGTVYSVLPDGRDFTTLRGFDPSTDGAWPCGLLWHGSLLYGTTYAGGGGGMNGGMLYSMEPDGADFRSIHPFPWSITAGEAACHGRALIPDGDILYGTALYGPQTQLGKRMGHVYSVNRVTGQLTSLHSFGWTQGDDDDSYWKQGGPLVVDGDQLFGMTPFGGVYGKGMIFAVGMGTVSNIYTQFSPAETPDSTGVTFGIWHIRGSEGQSIAFATGWGFSNSTTIDKQDAKGMEDCRLVVSDATTPGVWQEGQLQGADLTWTCSWGYGGTVPVSGDYDGDGTSDLAVYDQRNGNWYIRSLTKGPFVWKENWGYWRTVPVSGDYDGDGHSDLAVYDVDNGEWYIRSVAGKVIAWKRNWGFAGAVPVPGDFDADGAFDLAVYHPGTGNWYVQSLAKGDIAWRLNWGYPGTVAVPGDYDGDGASDLCVYDASAGCWFMLDLDRGPIGMAIRWGFQGADAVPGDYDGDGRSDACVYDRAAGAWFVRRLGGRIITSGTVWGSPGAIAVAGDYNGDGPCDLAVYVPSNGRWSVKRAYHGAAR